MKKIVLNISESTYEKLRFEALEEKKSIQEVLKNRIFFKPFQIEVEEAFENWIELETKKLLENV